MKSNTLYFALLILLFNSCKSDFERRNFLLVETGNITTSTSTSVSLESEIIGVSTGKIAEHGYVFSCVNNLPTLNTDSTERKLLGVKLDGGQFSATIENLDLNTTYFIRAFALLDEEVQAEYGAPVTFRSSEYSLEVTTDSFNFLVGGFELFGTVRNLEPGVVLERYGFVWSNGNELPDLENDNPIYLGSIDTDTSFSKKEFDVVALENYYVRAFAQIGKDVFYGETISFFKGDVWIQKQNVPFPKDGVYAGAVNNKIYVGGGYGSGSFNDLQSYDPLSDSWIFETPLDVVCHHGAAFSIGDSLYVVTGNNSIGTDLWLYNTIDQTWDRRTDFPVEQKNQTIGHAFNGIGYVGMGRNGNSGHNGELWSYDSATNSWLQIPDFPAIPRGEPIVFSFGSELFIGFGYERNDLYAFNTDPNSWTWSEKAPIPDPNLFAAHFGSMVIGNKAYILAGVPNDNFWAYDIPTNTWEKKANYPGNPIGYPVLFQANNRGYLCMGIDELDGNAYNETMWEYIPDSK